MRILVITTGGTIGALPVEDIKAMPHIKDMPTGGDAVQEVLTKSFFHWDTRCVSLEPRDSNFIDRAYRENIARIIEDAEENRVILTHGTDTILDTAQFLYDRTLACPGLYKDKAIIITGSMVPLANGPLSDGFKNIELSLQTLSSVLAPCLAIVLFGYDVLGPRQGTWTSRFYPFEPRRYQRYYDATDPTKDGLAPYGYAYGRAPQS